MKISYLKRYCILLLVLIIICISGCVNTLTEDGDNTQTNNEEIAQDKIDTNNIEISENHLQSENENIVQFSNKEFGEMLALAMDKPIDTITYDDLLEIKKLIIVGKTAWVNVDLHFNSWELPNDFSMTENGVLYEANKSFDDISDLALMINLEILAVNNCAVYDITPISGLVQLRELYLADNKITDVSALSNLENLEILDLLFNRIADIEPLESLTKLDKLYISHIDRYESSAFLGRVYADGRRDDGTKNADEEGN